MFSDCLLYVGVLPAVRHLIFTTPCKGYNLHNTLQGSYHHPSFTDEETEAQRAEGTTQSHIVSDNTKSLSLSQIQAGK